VLYYFIMEKLLHAYILSGPAAVTAEKARELAAGALCEGAGEKPCRVCRHCRKVLADIHPDVSYVNRQTDSGGKLRKELTVDQIRAVGAEAPVLPNEGRCKVYILPEADAMNTSAQNAFLKLLEEPPSFVRFLLCAEKPGQLLETVRSRCALLRLGGETETDPKTREQAERFLQAVSDPCELLRVCVELEKLDNRQAAAFVDEARRLAPAYVSDARSLLSLETALEQAGRYLNANGGVKHVMGFLSVYTNPTK